jgi:hypothetical protein
MASGEPSSPWKRAANTDRWTEILLRALSNRVAYRWRFVSFRGLGRREWRGIVDVLAIRKDTSKSEHHILKAGDLFEIVLIQMKGGSARPPTAADVRRLRTVAKQYRAKAVALFTWKKGKGCKFERLGRGARWLPSSATELFG